MSLILRNFLIKFKKYPGQVSNFRTAVSANNNQVEVKTETPITPILSTISYEDEYQMYQTKRQVWIDNLDTIKEKKLGLMTLHPSVFAEKPRVDTLYENVRWQRMYRFVNYAHVCNRAEKRGGGRKPWPQKGLGRARHGSVNSPLFKGGGVAHGPRSPTPHFYMLPFFTRVNGLTAALSVKLAQDDLYVVNNLDIPSNDPKYIEALIEERNWGPSVLIVDSEDIMPENITLATDNIKHVNLMPAYGLNVYSMLKHSTLVLTERATRHIESKLLYHLHRPDFMNASAKFKLSQA
ncbi:39S ribosomal protein L4, mitochondrial [Microplitis mediator]|uniref:39S ribosomal protein L4, mitochondrial n=1 Tax=Microplitis mediator TaxID=375433 RepID=UPI0025546DCB|nr:39S ribosomal protein L4, mitochondrial [Microplitis mediator]